MDTTCTVGIGDYRQLALGKQQYRYRHIGYIGRLGRLNKKLYWYRHSRLTDLGIVGS